MRPAKLYERLNRNEFNVRFRDMARLLRACGFHLDRVAGSHHIFLHPEVEAIVNLQDARGEAKPYQVRQVARILQRYALHPEDPR